jgi:hypothetical protein
MTVSLKHTFQSAKTDSGDATLVQPSNWNQEHDLTLATNKVLGRATAGTGAAEELSVGTALSISGGTLAVTTVPVANGGTGASTLTGYVKGNGTSAFTAAASVPVGDLSGTLPVASGGTGAATLTANNVLIGNGTSAVTSVAPGSSGNLLTSNGTTWASTAAPTSAVSFPQNSQSASYTLVLGDAGKQIFHPVSDTSTRRYTIPSNASVAFPIGTVVLFTVENAGTGVIVSINSDTLVFGSGTTGSLGVAANQTLMAIKVTATKWMANYLYQTGSATSLEAIAVPSTSSPYIQAYLWGGSGFGTKYSNPATLPTGTGRGVAFSPANNAIAVAHSTSPFITAYLWSPGFGTKYTDPATLPAGIGRGVAFSPAGTALAVAHDTSPYISTYPWTVGSGFGTKYSDPATLPTGSGQNVAFSPAGDAIAVAHTTSPFITAYPWNVSTGFGTKYTNPATLPTSFASDGSTLTACGNTTNLSFSKVRLKKVLKVNWSFL